VYHTPDRCFANKNGSNYQPSAKVQQSSLGKKKSSESASATRVPAPGTYRRGENVATADQSNNKKKKEVTRFEESSDNEQ